MLNMIRVLTGTGNFQKADTIGGDIEAGVWRYN
jgi:hypothetical protein